MKNYHMLKKDKEIVDRAEIIQIIKEGKFSAVGMSKEGQPYVVNLSYGYDENRHALYFHSALKGLKLDVLEYNSKVCASVVLDKGYVPGECNHLYRSVVLFGNMVKVTDLEEKKHGLNTLLNHLEDDPDKIKARFLDNEEIYSKVMILKLEIEHMTGKQS